METFDFWKFLAGLGVFLYGMQQLEHALRKLAGRSLKLFLREHTDHPLQAILSGVVVTAILQSSTVVSLMLLAFVGAGVIHLRNALGVIIGANLGTTFTGWIVATLGFKLNIEAFSLPFVAIGGLMVVFLSRREKISAAGKFLLGFGLLFLGLDFMKLSVDQLASSFDLTPIASYGILAFFAVGFVLTAIIQSSSAAMVITLSALDAGIIPLDSAAALVIGSDLGTTMTVVIGGLKGTAEKKRVALSHFLFNLITDLLALALLSPLLIFLQTVLGLQDPLITLVCFHSSFNLLGIVVAYPLLGVFARFLESCFTDDKEVIARFLPTASTEDVDTALAALENETKHLLERSLALNMFVLDEQREVLPPNKTYHSRNRPENYLDAYYQMKDLYGEIATYNLKAHLPQITESESARLNVLMLAVYNIGAAAKGFKDIRHNLHEFDYSANDTLHQLKNELCRQSFVFYQTLTRVVPETPLATLRAQLEDLRQQNISIRTGLLSNLNKAIRANQLRDIEISSLLNVSRELFDSNTRLLRALHDLWLPVKAEELADEVSAVPV